MEKVTISEFARRTGKSERTARKWADAGRLRTDYELINNRKTRVVIVDDEIINSFMDAETETGRPEQNTPLQNTMMPDGIPEGPVLLNKAAYTSTDRLNQIDSNSLNQQQVTDNNNIIFELVNQIKESHYRLNDLQHKLVSYAELAGQTKLLTASENQTKEEYFRVIQENATLKAKVELLQKELRVIEEKQSKLSNWLSKI